LFIYFFKEINIIINIININIYINILWMGELKLKCSFKFKGF